MEYSGLIFSVNNDNKNKKGSDNMKNEIKVKIDNEDVKVVLKGVDSEVLNKLEKKLRSTLKYNPDYDNCIVEKKFNAKVDSDAQLFN